MTKTSKPAAATCPQTIGRQQIDDEVAADGRRHEQHGRAAGARLAVLVEQSQETQLVFGVDDWDGVAPLP
jgi:hypothetical protein